MKLTPVTNTNFYGPEKRMAAERERIRAEETAKLEAAGLSARIVPVRVAKIAPQND